jgi:FtsH ternary system domain X2
MCNPRRVKITSTRDVCERWRREVASSVELSANVRGEVQLRQPLGSLGEPVRGALRLALTEGVEGWTPIDGGFRHEVAGGHLDYLIDEGALLIVATSEGTVREEATVCETLEGEVRAQLSAEGEGRYYDDRWGGHTPERAQDQAKAQAEEKLDQQVRAEIEKAKEVGANAVAAGVEEAAREKARRGLADKEIAERQRLEAEARKDLEAVGMRCNLAFNHLMSDAMLSVIREFTRQHGGEILRCEDGPGSLELELELPSGTGAALLWGQQ